MMAMLLALEAAPAPDLVDEPAVAEFCRLLLDKATAERFHEQGAFVVRTPEGLPYFVTWPAGEDKDHLRWEGRFPEGAIAIVHTHPPWMREPSKLDVRAARRTKLPVYVITPSGIVKTTGGEPEVVTSLHEAR